MYQAYSANLSAFDQGGGSLYVAYSFVSKQSKYGSWGHLQAQDEATTTAPKFRALLDFAESE